MQLFDLIDQISLQIHCGSNTVAVCQDFPFPQRPEFLGTILPCVNLVPPFHAVQLRFCPMSWESAEAISPHLARKRNQCPVAPILANDPRLASAKDDEVPWLACLHHRVDASPGLFLRLCNL